MAKPEMFWLGAGVVFIGGKEYGADEPLPPEAEIGKKKLAKWIAEKKVGARVMAVPSTNKAFVEKIGELENQLTDSATEKLELEKKLSDAIGRISHLEELTSESTPKIEKLQSQLSESAAKITGLEKRLSEAAATPKGDGK